MNSETFIVKRSEWERGTRSGSLYNTEAKCGCILGLYLIKYGADPGELDTYSEPYKFMDEVTYVATPIEVVIEADLWDDEEHYQYENTTWASRTIEINDDDGLSEAYREQCLIEHFATQGCTLRFVD